MTKSPSQFGILTQMFLNVFFESVPINLNAGCPLLPWTF